MCLSWALSEVAGEEELSIQCESPGPWPWILPSLEAKPPGGAGEEMHQLCRDGWSVLCLAAQRCPTLCDPMGCSPPGSLSKGFSSQEYWSGLPGPPPGDLPNPGIEPRSPALQAESLPSEPPGKPRNGWWGESNRLIPRAAPPLYILQEMLVLLIPAMGVHVCLGVCEIWVIV